MVDKKTGVTLIAMAVHETFSSLDTITTTPVSQHRRVAPPGELSAQESDTPTEQEMLNITAIVDKLPARDVYA